MTQNEINFGRFRLNLAKRELSCAGKPLKLGSRALDILCMLASANGEVVTKDALMAEVWPGIIVEENNIAVHVSALRKELSDGTDGQNFIVTIPGRGYRFTGTGVLLSAAQNPSGLETAPALPGTTIAVLPFQNMSGDPDQEYFADGVVEDIITGLSRIKWLFVIARNSSFIYRGNAIDIKQVSRELGVRYVLEGSVRKAGNRVRITSQLIDAQTGIHLWAERYDRLLDDIFALQDEIGMSVVGAIEPNLRKAEIERVKRTRTDNLDAYDLVLQALPYAYKRNERDASQAVPLLKKALELDPHYAAAHAILARCYQFIYRRGDMLENDHLAAVRHAHAAIIGGEDDATTLANAAYVIWFEERDIVRSFELFDRALAVSSSNVIALATSAVALAYMGKPDEAIERAQRALKLSPFDAFTAYIAIAIANFYVQRFGAALKAAEGAVDSSPHFSIAHAHLAAVLVRLGRKIQASASVQQVLLLEPKFTIRRWALEMEHLAGFEPIASAMRDAGIPEG